MTAVASPGNPTVIKMDVEGAEAEIILGSEYIRETKPRLFVEVHPPEIDNIDQKALERMFDRIFSVYTVEFIQNHWGITKSKGVLSVVDDPRSYEWVLADHDELMNISKDIIHNNIRPAGFAIHCFCRLEDHPRRYLRYKRTPGRVN
ncbi:MAG: FkbM family methyltransferase [Arenicellales bacterium]|jgi:hypothetical protein|nr:FkbM family methyltransferase [Pseudomonadales bacterium]MDP7452924.1 FkbM family methyltransferase [Arenicellales bacterium]MDP7518205.1 FkbM family methyltransferase [Arenicellales bacterium]|tara:strand:- start:979 stop:1419 length:441 start_codon:yes stop_codon:yes gene_type:complete